MDLEIYFFADVDGERLKFDMLLILHHRNA